jgi:hypothetical protein
LSWCKAHCKAWTQKATTHELVVDFLMNRPSNGCCKSPRSMCGLWCRFMTRKEEEIRHWFIWRWWSVMMSKMLHKTIFFPCSGPVHKRIQWLILAHTSWYEWSQWHTTFYRSWRSVSRRSMWPFCSLNFRHRISISYLRKCCPNLTKYLQ